MKLIELIIKLQKIFAEDITKERQVYIEDGRACEISKVEIDKDGNVVLY